jgi:hypothetical protein
MEVGDLDKFFVTEYQKVHPTLRALARGTYIKTYVDREISGMKKPLIIRSAAKF